MLLVEGGLPGQNCDQWDCALTTAHCTVGTSTVEADGHAALRSRRPRGRRRQHAAQRRIDRLRTAIVEPDRFGGTCLNRGCIPSKMFVIAADAAEDARAAQRLGVHVSIAPVGWRAVRDRVFSHTDPLHESAVDYRRKSGVDVYTEEARFVAPKVIQVADARITADTFVIAIGSRPVVPDIPGLDTVAYHNLGHHHADR
ncbi:FAD-dependent oxidoreductase [Streptomyces sp. NPDC058964]|uniref:FAD-dependent oxidoreductase n=1 Tax=Streptomyces sp. NPDC058964 TaxID=3346681 RepID=UPI00368678A2